LTFKIKINLVGSLFSPETILNNSTVFSPLTISIPPPVLKYPAESVLYFLSASFPLTLISICVFGVALPSIMISSLSYPELSPDKEHGKLQPEELPCYL